MMLSPPANSPPECAKCGAVRVAWNGAGDTRFKCGATTLMLALDMHPTPIGKTDAERAEHARSMALYKKHRFEHELGRDPLL